MLIVYDLDGTLNNLNEMAFSGLEEEYANLKYYNIDRNDNLTAAQKKLVMNRYKDVSVFKSLSPVSGADRIVDIKDKCLWFVDVVIHTHSLTDKVIPVKEKFISHCIPKLEPDKVIYSTGDAKGIISGADIIVEDSLEHLSKYSKYKVRILVDKPYNKFENYPSIDSTGIVRVDTLNDAVNYIERVALSLGLQ